MSFSEEEKKKALQFYDETGSISKVIQNWGIRADRICIPGSRTGISKENAGRVTILIPRITDVTHRWKQNSKYCTVALKKVKQ